MKILILTNNDIGLYKFRKELLEALLEKNHEVFIALPGGEFVGDLRAMGCRFIETPMERRGMNPFIELKLVTLYRRILREVRPDAVLTFTIKPNIYGGMACAAAGIPYIADVTGLGTAIENGGLLQKVLLRLYAYGLRKARMVFFENAENERFMVERHVVRGRHAVLPGAGVNLADYPVQPYPAETDKLIFSTVGRIMRDKGTDELLSAVREIKKKHPQVIFRLIGFFDEDYQAKVETAVREGIIEYIENQRDVRPYYAASHAIVHPSYHEGMSNVLLESAAAGRPLLTTNVPGCREAFDEGVSGYGFPPRDASALTAAIEKFIALPYEKKIEMGEAGRKKMEREFDRRLVRDQFLSEIEAIQQPKRALMTATVPSMIGQFNLDNIRCLLEKGYEVHVASNFDDRSVWPEEKIVWLQEELKQLGVPWHQIEFSRDPKDIRGILRAYRQINKLIKQQRFLFAHCHTPVASVLCRLACHKNHVKSIYTAHGFHFYKGAKRKNWLIYYPIEKWMSRYTDVLITINQEDYERARTRFHAKKTVYVPGIGIDIKRIQHTTVQREELRRSLGFAASDFIFLSIGELSARKNHETAIRALSSVPNAKYLIVGMGELRDRLLDLSRELGLEDRVILAGFRSDVFALLYAVDAFVFPSLQEGLPVALMEAMAAGLPVVASRIRGNVDLIEDGMGGYLYECKDIEGFSEGMRKVMTGSGKNMGQRNQDTIERFDVAVVKKEMEKIYAAIDVA